MTETETTEEGWGFPLASRKAHYFVGITSLCGSWLYTGRLEPETEKRSPDDCKACRRKLERREATP
jgi:hypothetical protein